MVIRKNCGKAPPVGHSPESIFSSFSGAAARKPCPQSFDGKILQPLVMNTTSFLRELANRALDDKAEVPPKHQKMPPRITKALKSLKSIGGPLEIQ